MTPFQEFRLWARRAPTIERVTASVVACVVLALLVWAIIPSGGSSSSTASAQGNQGISTSLPIVPPTSPPPRPKCVTPTGSVPGVTATQIRIGILVVNIQGAATNAGLGILPVTTQKTVFSRIVADINKAGGLDCRQIVPVYFSANSADQSALQQTCLQVTQANVFAVVDAGAYAQFPVVDCFPQHKLPYFGGYLLPTSQLNQFYPYLFELNSLDVLYHDTVGGLAQRGWFKAANGFKELGVVYEDCYPQIYKEVRGWLTQAGVPNSQIVSYDIGCPAAFANPVQMEQAILKFKHAHVTNTITVTMVQNFPLFTKIAASQNFNPKYGVADDSLITTSYGATRPDPHNVNGAIAITQSREGENRTPGMTRTSGTLKCNAVIGMDVWSLPAAAGNACDQFWMLQGAIDYAPTLSQSSLAAGLKASETVNFSYPQGPNDFAAGDKITYAGQYWRVAEFFASCACWKVVDQTFHRNVQ